MRRLASLAVAASAALAAAGCGTSACQELGEKLCNCTPGSTSDSCRTQVQDQLNDLGVDTPGFAGIVDRLQANEPVSFEEYCQRRLDACVAPADLAFCDWLITPA